MNASQIADALVAVVDEFSETLLQLDEDALQHRPTPDRWTIRQVIGHLVDSAANNHQRFVRAQLSDDVFRFPKYEQNRWVETQDYATVDWPDLVGFWRLYNRHLAHVICRIPQEHLGVSCEIDTYAPCTLEFLVSDYLVHLEHHLDKIRERLG